MIKNDGAIPPLPVCLCGIVHSYIMKFIDYFTSAVSRVTIEKLTVSQLFRKFPTFVTPRAREGTPTLSEMYLVSHRKVKALIN
jgi:hypothetical protein